MLKFLSDRAGSIGVAFGLLAIPITLSVGFAIDFTRLSLAQAGVQGLVDRAAISGATLNQSITNTDDEDVKNVARSYLSASSFAPFAATIQTMEVTLPTTETLRIRVTGRIKLTIMALIGTEYVDFDITADAIRGMNGTLEVVLALDTTGSMSSGSKFTTAKQAANDLIDTLKAQTAADIKYALVPFANYVNVGLMRRNDPYLTVPTDSTSNVNECRTVTNTSSPSCVTSSTTCYKDGVPYGCTTTTGCGTKQECKIWTNTSKWNGCVGSRSYPLNTNVENFPLSRIPGVMNITCSSTIIPLTANATTVKTAVNTMVASGETYIPAGMIWAFNLLTPGGPASTAAAWDSTGINRKPRKVIVLMTDGENTKSQNSVNPAMHDYGKTPLTNTRTLEICTNAKAKKIEIFAVAFQVTDAST
ncbi:MAG: pilus assembly protein TadG-related protein, partial [Gloeotrichia echinulata HAB0833]